MLWYDLGLIAIGMALATTVTCSPFDRVWRRVRFAVVLELKMAGVLLGTWLLISYAERSPIAIFGTPSSHPIEGASLAAALIVAAERSLALMVAATVIGIVVGVGGAYLLLRPKSSSRNQLQGVAFVATVIWVIPSFLVAAVVQEVQAQIYGASGVGVTGGYGTVSILSAGWASLVLGIRPAAYVFRQAQLVLREEASSDHVRSAIAKGLPWRAVRRRHVVRPAAPALIANWVAAFRVMVGSLPLIEFFFAYPGLGMQLVLALGISYPDQSGHFQPDLAIGLVSVMAAILMSLELAGTFAQQILDPRLHELRSDPA